MEVKKLINTLHPLERKVLPVLDKVITVKDIAKALDVKMPSVTSAIEKLAEKNLVNHEKYGYVELTTAGEKIASEICRRHEVLFKFLSETLNIDPETAKKDACKIEHVISPTTLERLVKFIQFVEYQKSDIFLDYLGKEEYQEGVGDNGCW